MQIEKLIEINEYKGEGYQPVVAFESWRVAILNFSEIFIKENIPYLEKHMLTDEVFVLLRGSATLYIADGEEVPESISSIEMALYKTYNIKKGVWHNIEIVPESQVLIVENDNTARDNSRFFEINSDMLP